MAFQNLRNGNQLFILHKDSIPTLEIGKVTNVSVPIPKYGNPGIYNQEMVVDIIVEENGQTTNFQKLPAAGEIADCGRNPMSRRDNPAAYDADSQRHWHSGSCQPVRR